MVLSLAPAGWLWLGLVGNFIFCGARPVIDGLMFAVLQTIIPPERQGRVLSIILSGSAASALVGLLVAGPVVDLTSLPLWFGAAGCISAGVGVGGFFLGEIMMIEERQSSMG